MAGSKSSGDGIKLQTQNLKRDWKSSTTWLDYDQINTISAYLQGEESRFKRMQRPSIPE